MLHTLHRCCAPLLLSAVLGFTVAGCGSSGGSGGTGRMAVYLADAPGPDGVTEVHVTVTKVEAHVNGNWMTVVADGVDQDLLKVQRVPVMLGTASLPAGHYTQLRVFVDNPYVVDGTGRHDLTIPSGDQTGIKINIDGDIAGDQETAVLLDFNVSQSLVLEGNGQYKFKPVIKAVLLKASASITGQVVRDVSGTQTPVVGATVDAVYTSGGSYAAGTIVNTTATAAEDTTQGILAGSFKLWALLPGTYKLNVTWTDTTTTPGTVYSGTMEGVIVSEGQALTLGAPIVIAPPAP